MRSQMEVFGIDQPHQCEDRLFFKAINHPGASNCACPKMDDGLSCVPVHMRDAWFAYIYSNVLDANT